MLHPSQRFPQCASPWPKGTPKCGAVLRHPSILPPVGLLSCTQGDREKKGFVIGDVPFLFIGSTIRVPASRTGMTGDRDDRVSSRELDIPHWGSWSAAFQLENIRCVFVACVSLSQTNQLSTTHWRMPDTAVMALLNWTSPGPRSSQWVSMPE